MHSKQRGTPVLRNDAVFPESGPTFEPSSPRVDADVSKEKRSLSRVAWGRAGT
jgi:hypothetical protein